VGEGGPGAACGGWAVVGTNVVGRNSDQLGPRASQVTPPFSRASSGSPLGFPGQCPGRSCLVENRPAHIGLANTVLAVAVSVVPLIGGWPAGAKSSRTMFVPPAIIGMVSRVLLSFAAREPRKSRTWYGDRKTCPASRTLAAQFPAQDEGQSGLRPTQREKAQHHPGEQH
jgi:hypothetical protein